MKRFLAWWVSHSAIGLIIYAIMRLTGNWETAGGFGKTMAEIGLMASPLGAAIMWGAVRFWWWFLVDVLFGMVAGFLGVESRPKLPSVTKIAMNNGIFGSRVAGSEYRVDNSGWVYEAGMAGRRVGRIDDEGLWRSETGEIVGRIDKDGALRAHDTGLLSGVFTSQEGTGEELGRAE